MSLARNSSWTEWQVEYYRTPSLDFPTEWRIVNTNNSKCYASTRFRLSNFPKVVSEIELVTIKSRNYTSDDYFIGQFFQVCK